eukprot:1156571-Pelagomonas_calceolata.AAC.6
MVNFGLCLRNHSFPRAYPGRFSVIASSRKGNNCIAVTAYERLEHCRPIVIVLLQQKEKQALSLPKSVLLQDERQGGVAAAASTREFNWMARPIPGEPQPVMYTICSFSLTGNFSLAKLLAEFYTILEAPSASPGRKATCLSGHKPAGTHVLKA